MADPNTRQGKRTPVTLKIKFKSETLEQFIERYAVDVSQGGIFIRTKEPLAVGTQMKFEFQLRDASPLISGEGTVVWTRENDPSRPAIAPGMGVRFDRLNEGSQGVLEKILAEKAKQAPQRGAGEPTKPPMFAETPTRVAAVPEGLAQGTSGRTRQDSGQTPLPKPMPFHSDADDFDENAFQEATKVRSLEDLAAATAGDVPDTKSSTVVMPADELAARRQHGRPETPLAEPPAPMGERGETIPDRESIPNLPSPPAAPEAARPKLDTSPSPRTEAPAEAARTKLGMEPAKAETAPPRPASQKIEVPRPVAAAAETSRPVAPKRPSIAPIVIGVLVVVAAALAGVWWFVIKPGVTDEGNKTATGSASTVTGSAGSAAITPGSAAGSAAAMAGSGSATPEVAGSAGSATQMAAEGSGSAAEPAGPTVDTIVTTTPAKATVEVEGEGQSGPAPFTAKLVKDQHYKVRVQAPGFVTKDVDVTGGQAKLAVKLDPKPRVLEVTSEPAGAYVFVDGVTTGKVTPAEITLTAAQAARSKVNVLVRKAGFRAADQVIDASAFTEADDKLTSSVDVKLVVYRVEPPRPHPGNTGAGSGSGSGNGSGSGSAAAPENGGEGSGSGSGSGSTETPATGTGTGTGTGSGTGTGTGTATGSASAPAAGSAEPEPNFNAP